MLGGGCKMPITWAHAWGRCIHQEQATTASQSIPAQQIHLNPLKRCPLSPGQPWCAPVPASPPVPARGPCAPPSLQCDLSRAGSAEGQPQREKTAIASPLISTLSGWRDTRGVGAGTGAARTAQGVTPRLPPKSCSDGGTRFQGRLIPFGAPLLHRYRISIKQIEDTQGQVPALLKKKSCFSSQDCAHLHAWPRREWSFADAQDEPKQGSESWRYLFSCTLQPVSIYISKA